MPNSWTILPSLVRFEPFHVEDMVDVRGRYVLDVDPSFPLAISAFHFDPEAAPYPLNWHERFEIFAPISGYGQFQMGERVLD